jgi:glucan phosphoethanolaminetransferase (alkaline phosphatase superfamily)
MSLTMLVECSTGDRKQDIVVQSVLLMALDTVGDILSALLYQYDQAPGNSNPAIVLVIPFSLIWKIRVRLSQKIVLVCSLCLTILMAALSIVRVCGLVYGDAIDSVWQTYWQFLGSEIGLFLASAVALRAFFMARSQPSNAVPFSFKRVLKNSLSGPNKRPLSDTLHDSWSRMPDSELESLAPGDLSGPDTGRGIGASR